MSRALAGRLRRLREWLTERSCYTLEGDTVADAATALEDGRALPYGRGVLGLRYKGPQVIGELKLIAKDYTHPTEGRLMRRVLGETGIARVSSVCQALLDYQRKALRP